MLLNKHLDRFCHYLIHYRQFSKHTVSSYQFDLRQFFKFLKTQNIQPDQNINANHAYAFIKFLIKQAIKPRSVARKVSSCRHFFEFLIAQNKALDNPFAQIELPKKTHASLPCALDVDSILALLNQMPNTQVIEIRDRAIIELLYACGLRLSELYQLNVSSVLHIEQKGEIQVLGKGKKHRLIPIHRVAISCIQNWLDVYSGFQKTPDEQALFINRFGRRLSMRGIQKRIEFWGRFLGLSVHLHPHVFRHSVASHLLESSQNLRMVQKFLGHSSLATTQVYTHLDFQHLSRVYDQAHPRARLKKSF